MDGEEPRVLLRAGDALLKAGDHAGALELYARVARIFVAQGATLKAIAVYVQLRRIIRRNAPQARDLENEARAKLPVLYRAVGLHDDAIAVESESGMRPNSLPN